MEMLRRFVLVGVFVIVRPGSIEQLAWGALTALVYCAIQVSASPFRKASDDFFATSCSMLLAALFLW